MISTGKCEAGVNRKRSHYTDQTSLLEILRSTLVYMYWHWHFWACFDQLLIILTLFDYMIKDWLPRYIIYQVDRLISHVSRTPAKTSGVLKERKNIGNDSVHFRRPISDSCTSLFKNLTIISSTMNTFGQWRNSIARFGVLLANKL